MALLLKCEGKNGDIEAHRRVLCGAAMVGASVEEILQPGEDTACSKKISHKKAQKAQRDQSFHSLCAFCAFLWLIFLLKLKAMSSYFGDTTSVTADPANLRISFQKVSAPCPPQAPAPVPSSGSSFRPSCSCRAVNSEGAVMLAWR